MIKQHTKKYVFISAFFHLALLLIILLKIDLFAKRFVIENTSQQDVISAVVLGDVKESKILPQQVIQSFPHSSLLKAPPKKIIAPPPTKIETIPLKVLDKQRELLAKDLLTDIEKITQKQKQLQQKKMRKKFEKLLHEQAEKSMRQQLLNEEIKLRGMQTRLSQGQVDRYKALILQAISEQWIIPTHSNKKLYCELIIRVAPGGMVLDVQVIKSSGDVALDYSARAAVLKASPLPVPKESAAFEPFRKFVLKVKPENIVNVL